MEEPINADENTSKFSLLVCTKIVLNWSREIVFTGAPEYGVPLAIATHCPRPPGAGEEAGGRAGWGLWCYYEAEAQHFAKILREPLWRSNR